MKNCWARRVSPVQYSPRRQSRWVLADYGGKEGGVYHDLPPCRGYTLQCRSAVLTTTSCAKRFLSSGGLPRSAGYSKSRSRPSNWRSRRNSILVRTNSDLLDALRNIDVILATPKFHPPTASSVFTAGWRSLTSLNVAYLSPFNAMAGHSVQAPRSHCRLLCPRPHMAEALSDDACLTSVCLCLTSVCLSRTSSLSREQKGLGRLIKLAQR